MGDAYSLGEKIEELRKARGWSQIYLADRIGASKSAVSLWEKGERKPSMKALGNLAKVFGVSTDYLVTGKRIDADNIDFALFREIKSRPEIIMLLEYARKADRDDVITVASILEKITR